MDDYIKKIRKYIGHEPMLIPHAVVIVLNEKNEALVEVRADDGYHDFPGGAIDINETVEEAAKRELYEETGLIADELEEFKIYSGEITKYTYFSGDVIYGVDIFYICRKWHGVLKPQLVEVSSLKFMNIDDIKGPISIRNQQVVKDLKEYVKRD